MGFYYVFNGWESEICFWSLNCSWEVDTHLEQLSLFKIIDIFCSQLSIINFCFSQKENTESTLQLMGSIFMKPTPLGVSRSSKLLLLSHHLGETRKWTRCQLRTQSNTSLSLEDSLAVGRVSSSLCWKAWGDGGQIAHLSAYVHPARKGVRGSRSLPQCSLLLNLLSTKTHV